MAASVFSTHSFYGQTGCSSNPSALLLVSDFQCKFVWKEPTVSMLQPKCYTALKLSASLISRSPLNSVSLKTWTKCRQFCFNQVIWMASVRFPMHSLFPCGSSWAWLSLSTFPLTSWLSVLPPESCTKLILPHKRYHSLAHSSEPFQILLTAIHKPRAQV